MCLSVERNGKVPLAKGVTAEAHKAGLSPEHATDLLVHALTADGRILGAADYALREVQGDGWPAGVSV